MPATDFTSLSKLGELVAVDTETTGLRRFAGDRPFAISMCDDEGETFYRRWEVDPYTRNVMIPDADRTVLSEFFHSRRRFVYHHGKFDVSMLAHAGVSIPRGSWDDTLVAMRCLRSGELGFGLKPLAHRYCDYPMDDEKDLVNATKKARREGKKKGYRLAEDTKADYWLAPPELCEKYAVGDVERTMMLWLLLREKLDEEEVRETYELEMDIQPIATEMEELGVIIDMDLIRKGQSEIVHEMAELYREIEKHAWKGFNPNSNPQKGKLLFDVLGVRPTEWTKKGHPSCAAAALEKVVHPVAQLLVRYADLGKQLSFFEQWEFFATKEGEEWVLHPSVNPQAARTGRFSYSDPNLQQVPSRDPVASYRMRSAFKPRPGKVWIASDYSQMELRMMASRANEQTMLQAFRDGVDIHDATCLKMIGEIDKKNRTKAKNTNFGKSYGAGPEKLAITCDIPIHEAVDFATLYDASFPGIPTYMKEISARAKRDGHIRNVFGRKIEVHPKKPYAALNYDIQSSGADVIKRAMRELQAYLQANCPEATMVLQIHDELVVEVDQDKASIDLMRQIKRIMEESAEGKFAIPLRVDVDYCETSWADTEEVVL